MAFNLSQFKTRAISAIIFAAVMLMGLLWSTKSFIILFFIIMFGCYAEFRRLLLQISPQKYINRLPLALPYILLPIGMMIDLGTRGDIHHLLEPLFPCVIVFGIWINDTMAYIVGSLIGKTPFSPISPKKTWEGTIGGALISIAVISIIASKLEISRHISLYHWLIIASVIAIFGTLGDLLESKIKRLAGVKDSGNLMPGHGGFLDRFDSMLLAIPAVWIYVRLILKAA
jgi:phosphatidate cytidylyltransferase